MHIPKYTLLPYREAVIDNEIMSNDLFQIIGYSKNITNHAIMNVCISC